MTEFTFPNNKALATYFSDSYLSCREDFLTRVNTLSDINIAKRSWAVPEHPQHRVDSALIGPADAHNVLVFISGTHGVEGYCGSAAQRFLLHQLDASKTKLPPDAAIFMVHALNPWGMDNARRTDHEGIDLNRNFIDFTKNIAADTYYSRIHAIIRESDHSIRKRLISSLKEEIGQERFERAFSGGQYVDAQAPFYGGRHPAFAHITIDNIIDDFTLSGRELTVIDIHSGLGPWAFGELISDHPAQSNGNIFAKKMFGEAVAITENGESFSVPKTGLMDYRWHQLMHNSGCYLTLEFGTYGTEALFDVLLDEHIAWHKDNKLSPTAEQEQRLRVARETMLRHFFPADTLWQEAVLFKTWQVLNRFMAFYS